MAAGLISFRGSDVFVTGADKETRFPVGEAVNRLRDWAQRYDSASGRDDEAALLSIGREMFGWLDASGWASHWAKAPDDRALEIRVDGTGDEQETALLDAPWELLAREDGPLALDALQLFAVFRRIGTAGAVREPTRGDIRLMFMAAAPEGQTVLDFEGEEAAILEATRGSQRVHLVVEETGALESLGERLTSEEGPFEALHLACHGDIRPERGPVLMLETTEGGEAQAGPGELVGKLGPPEKRPPLVVLSACRTAEIGAGKGGRMKASGARRDAGVSAGASPELMASFARQLATMAANVVGWDGSVYDRDATEFAAVFYRELGLQRASVPRAAAVGRRELLRARGGDRSSGRGLHWHLARVYLGPGGGGPLCEEGKPVQVARPAEKAFLDKDRGRVPVAPREAFVGRRRTLQRALRAFRDGPAGVLIHGMGALGKSSLAARLASRTPLRPVLVFERYDALAVFDEIVAALPPQDRASARTGWREAIEADESCLGDALEALLSGPLEAAPILLIVDDLERILETPKPGAEKTAVDAAHRAAVGAILKAFAQAATRSRLLITSRYDFRVPDGKGDPAGRLTRLHLQPMPERDRTKQLRAAERLAGREGAERDPTVTALLARAIAAAGGNPGLQEALTRPALAGEVDAAETALGRIEHFQATGAPPADVRALIEDGTAKDSDNALIAFFGRLAFETYRDALTDEEARQLSAATLFSEGVPVPVAALAAAGQALGVEAPRTAIARLLGLGLFDDWGEIGGHAHAAANALARPLAAPLEDADRPRLARAAFAELEVAWRDAEGGFPKDPRGVVAAETALKAGQLSDRKVSAFVAGATYLLREANDISRARTFIHTGLSCARRSSEYFALGLPVFTLYVEFINHCIRFNDDDYDIIDALSEFYLSRSAEISTRPHHQKVIYAELLIRLAEYYLDDRRTLHVRACIQCLKSIGVDGLTPEMKFAITFIEADWLVMEGLHSKSIRLLRKTALSILETKARPEPEYIRCLTKIGTVFFNRNKLNVSEQFFRKAVQHCERASRFGLLHEYANATAMLANCVEAYGNEEDTQSAQEMRLEIVIPSLRLLGASRDLLLVDIKYLKCITSTTASSRKDHGTIVELLREGLDLSQGTELTKHLSPLIKRFSREIPNLHNLLLK